MLVLNPCPAEPRYSLTLQTVYIPVDLFLEGSNMILGVISLYFYFSSIIWSEQNSLDKTWQMYRSDITGENITTFFTDSKRQRRAVNVPCNCPNDQRTSSALAMDLSQDGHTEVIFVDDSNNILAADVYGCHCRTLFQTTPGNAKGMCCIYPKYFDTLNSFKDCYTHMNLF